MNNDDATITKVPQRPVQRLEYDAPTKMYRRAPNADEITKPKKYSLTFWQKVRLTPYVFQFFKGVIMKDAKTTITAIVGAAAYVVNALFGIGIPQDAIVAVTVFVIGLFASDSKED